MSLKCGLELDSANTIPSTPTTGQSKSQAVPDITGLGKQTLSLIERTTRVTQLRARIQNWEQ